MATTTTATTEAGAADSKRVQFGRARWIWPVIIFLALLPVIGGKTGLISNYGFLQLSLMIV
jgi:hypothetical protein